MKYSPDDIKKYRKTKNLTQQEMANLMGISREMFNKIESGKIAISRTSSMLFEKIQENKSESISHGGDMINEPRATYQIERQNKKLNETDNELMYYNIGASAGTAHSAEILPVKKSDGVLHINDLFKGSQYAIRISGNSMTPNYPSGAIIGIREVHDKIITPGSVYVIEKESDLWIKRLFYKDDNQNLGFFECVSDNQMKYENGSRLGKYYYPTFEIAIDAVRKLFKVTGIYKPNELTVIN